jgi:hypothetical protein
MTARTRGIIVALLHLLLVVSLGGKLLVDRATLPRVWASVAPFDPDLPIRGRYVSLQVEVTPLGFEEPSDELDWVWAKLAVENDRLTAKPAAVRTYHYVTIRKGADGLEGTLGTPIAFFIPENVEDPSRLPGLMVELTVPRKGPPRPIRLGVAKEDGIEPLSF